MFTIKLLFRRVNNCVGFANYKFFVLFLAYAVTYCLFIALSSIKYYFIFWTSEGDRKADKDDNQEWSVRSVRMGERLQRKRDEIER